MVSVVNMRRVIDLNLIHSLFKVKYFTISNDQQIPYFIHNQLHILSSWGFNY